MRKIFFGLFLILFGIISTIYYSKLRFIDNDELIGVISRNFFNSKMENPKPFEVKGRSVSYSLTINSSLQKYCRKLLKRYKTPYSAVVVLDNNTSEILAMAGYDRKHNKKYDELTLSTTNPGASLFKIVSSAALLETKKVKANSFVSYNGKGTTLYKYQLKNRRNKWTRSISLKRSFAHSNNVSFGKFAQKYLSPVDLLNMAERFGFNKPLLSVINSSKSSFTLAKSDYQLAEFSSGFNKVNTISPLHAAYLSSVVANDGIRSRIKLVKNIFIDNDLVDLHKRKIREEQKYRVFSKNTASQLKSFMLETVKNGTARGLGRLSRRNLRHKLRIGAKTGSITGGFPEGKREWITAFAQPKDSSKKKGISVAVINVLDKKWYVRSSYIARKVIEYYYTKVSKI